jgi:restriction alleviation protein Lar
MNTNQRTITTPDNYFHLVGGGKEMTLLPCPFCGIMPEIKKIWFFGTNIMGYDAHCPKCGAMPTRNEVYKTAELAIERWNTRVTSAPESQQN